MFINALVNEAKVNKLSTNQDQCYLSRLAKRSAAFGWKGGDLWDQPEAFFIFQFFLNPTIIFFKYILGDIFLTRADIEVNHAYIVLGQSETFRDDEWSAFSNFPRKISFFTQK